MESAKKTHATAAVADLFAEDDVEMNPEDTTPLELQRELIAGQPLLILRQIDSKGTRYLVGVEIAKLLKQQTYNMYRSMKSKGIQLNRANQHCLSFLRHKKAVPRNTHSVTLVPYLDGIRFIFEKIRERQKIEKQNQVALEILSKKTISTPTSETPLQAPTSVAPNAVHLQQVPMLSQYSPTTTDHWRTPRSHLSTPSTHFVPRTSFMQPQVSQNHFVLPRQFPPSVPRTNSEIPSFPRHELFNDNSFASLLSLANLSEIEAQKLDEERKLKIKATPVPMQPSEENTTSQHPGWLDLLMNATPPPIIPPQTPSQA